MWASVCVAIGVTRRRAVPGGTVGGRIACASTPRSSSASAKRIASALSPSMTGMMCVSPAAREAQRGAARARSRAAFASSARGARARAATRSERRAGRGDRAPAARPGRVDEAARAVHHQVDERARSGDVRAGAAERLAERAHLHGDLARRARRASASPAPRGPSTPVAWASSSITLAVIRSRQRDEVTQRGPVAVHGEDRIGDDQAAAALRGRGQHALRARRTSR